jgi:hypothetical protein
MTYARSKYAPFGGFRERPTDRGRDARRYRDESFGALADLARLCGPALAFEPAGDATFLGRPARRYRLALAREPAATPAAATASPGPEPDADTRARRAFLEGRQPLALEGELLADAATGVPLRAHLKGTFAVKDDRSTRAQVDLVAQVRTLGAAVGAISAPKGALPDARKPPGVSDALEASGLKRGEKQEMGRAEPAGEGD